VDRDGLPARLEAGLRTTLGRFASDLLDLLLAFYFEPGEPRRLAQAALAHR
jgi:hypothetical protein